MKIDNLSAEALADLIEKANVAYRTGEAIMSDAEYDALIDRLETLTKGKHPLLKKVGFEVPEEDIRKEKLPVPMYSMNKVKTVDEFQKWARLKKIPKETIFVVTPKYDGLSFLVDEETKDAWTRGNGIEGQRSNAHLALLMKNKPATPEYPGFSYGEIIMKREVFATKWAEVFKNSRNMGAGAMNRKDPDPMLMDFDFIRYGLEPKSGEKIEKLKQLEILNRDFNEIQVPFLAVELGEITEELLQQKFKEFAEEYETDGLILEVDDTGMRAELGRETTGNPAYARAWKGFGEMQAVTHIVNVTWQVSKQGYLKPVAQIEPVELDGVTVSNVTLNNASYMEKLGLDHGAKVVVIRSGAVIPKIIEVVDPAEVNLPEECPSCGTATTWNETRVELMCPNPECPEKKIQQLVSFFSIMGVEEFAEKMIRQFVDAGYDTVEKILKMSMDEILEQERFAARKADLVYRNIHDKMNDVPLERLQHASGVFEGLGTKKLKLLKQWSRPANKPAIEEVIAIEGFSDKLAKAYVENYDKFWEFVKDLPVTIRSQAEKQEGGRCAGMAVCFSGIRRKDLEEIIEAEGGKVVSGVSKNTTHLVMKEKGSGSSKEKKAEDLGVTIWTVDELEDFLGGNEAISQ